MSQNRIKRVLSCGEEISSFSLTDILDVTELQEIQDAFSRASGIASTICDPFGTYITQPSNHCRVCKIIRATPKGHANCRRSARILGERSHRLMGPNSSPCHSIGFIDASAPIIVNDRHLANWLIGQNFVGDVDEARVVEYAKEIEADPEEMIEAFREIPKMDRQRFEDILDFLWRMAGQISTLGYRNLKMARMVEESERSRDELAGYKARLEVLVNDRTRELSEALEKVKRLSVTDALTGCFNRAFINDHLPREIKRARRYDRPLSVILCDIDHFKRINDSFGHKGGDQALIDVVKCLQAAIRNGLDWVGRYGGEEFLIVLPETSHRAARDVAERLRQSVAECQIYDQEINITASFGVCSMQPSEERSAPAEMDYLLFRADACLYRAKREGRNCVVGDEIGS